MSLFKGAGVALITPFNKDKSVNYDELGRIIDRQIEGKTDALIVCGTTGEPATMTEEEKLSVIEFAVKRTAGRKFRLRKSGRRKNKTLQRVTYRLH